MKAGSSRGGPDGVDNPDQRISSDVSAFTDTALSLSLTLLNAFIDLVSFSGILFSIYPPLFIALVTYSIGGTAASLALGKVSMIPHLVDSSIWVADLARKISIGGEGLHITHYILHITHYTFNI